MSTGMQDLDETIPGELETLGAGAGALEVGDFDLQLTRIDDYVLLHRVGEGAMGVVYAAYDEQLDRKVAIKLLHRAGHSRPRLVREAQALARLSHPNVVHVYEIGSFEDTPFIVMEFVDGETVGAWLRAARRSRDEILAVFAAAGEGLVAAHEKGLVHRDFKPENVMVSRDGRVLVMDFGLARGKDSVELDGVLGPDELEASGIERSASMIPADLTATGAVMGTPAYMAPEQYKGAEVGPAADQFSFCVALWEALCGQRPFGGANLMALVAAVSSGRVREPEVELPSWLRKVLERGLAVEPEQRWPSMAALLAALADDPTRRRRVIGIGGAALLALVIGGGSAVKVVTEQREAEVAAARAATVAACEVEGQALAQVWSSERQAKLAQTFATTKRGDSGEAWTRTAAYLDAYAEVWTQVRTSVCLDAELEGQGERAEQARQCLDGSKVMFESLLDAWTEPTDAMVSRAPAAAAELPEVSACTDPRWLALQVPPPEDREDRRAVLDLRARLERVAALNLAGNYREATDEAEAVLVVAAALGWRPVEVEARFALGDVLERLGEFERSEAELRRALFEAGEFGHDLFALQAASKLTWTVGVGLADHHQALIWGELGQMFLTRMGLGETIHAAKLHNAIAAVRHRQGHDMKAALADYRAAMDLRIAALGPNHPLVAASLNNVALVESALGEFEVARTLLVRALAIREASLGSTHPEVAATLNNLALIHTEHGKHEEALKWAERALPILEAALGPEHAAVGQGYSNLGVIQVDLGDYDGALASHQRGLEIKRAALGDDHPSIAVSLSNMGEAQRLQGELERARATLEQGYAVAGEAKRLPRQRAEHAFSYAQVLAQLGDPRMAATARASAELAAGWYRELGKAKLKELAEVEAWLAEHPAGG